MSTPANFRVRRGRGRRKAETVAQPPGAILDRYAAIPILVCAFALIGSPLLILFSGNDATAMDGRPETRIFWPAMAAVSLFFTVQNRSRLTIPPNIVFLFAYLALAGLSVLWAFSPNRSFIRYLQQVMIVVSIVFPVLLASKRVDLLRGLFWCYLLALIINLGYVVSGAVTIVRYGTQLVNIGYEGYFNGKNYLGECATAGLLLSLNEILARGARRVVGVLAAVLALVLVYLSDSKTAFGLAFVSPLLAAGVLVLRRMTRLSPALLLALLPLGYLVMSHVSNFNVYRISYILYHDSTLTGRTIIWDFVASMIDRSPIVGWGYQSFWLVPDSPALGAPGWVKMMPNAHNGYYDTTLETGFIGLAVMLAFIFATIHGIGRVADQDPRRALVLLSIAVFIALYNLFESLWMRGFEFLWILFVIVAAEIGRYWRTAPVHNVARRPARRLLAQKEGLGQSPAGLS